jgi:predicted Zn-dependent protease
MKSFKPLTDQAKINKQPTLIKIVESKRNASLQQILNEYNMPSAKHNELALLNGMELDSIVESGTLLKFLEANFNNRKKNINFSP